MRKSPCIRFYEHALRKTNITMVLLDFGFQMWICVSILFLRAQKPHQDLHWTALKMIMLEDYCGFHHIKNFRCISGPLVYERLNFVSYQIPQFYPWLLSINYLSATLYGPNTQKQQQRNQMISPQRDEHSNELLVEI